MKIKNAAGFVIFSCIYSIIMQSYWFYERTFGEGKEYWEDKSIQSILQLLMILVPISLIVLGFSALNGSNNSEENKELIASNSLNLGFKIICFLIPIVGLVLYIVEKEKNPSKANSAGKYALWGFLISILIALISIVYIYSIYKNSMSHY